MKLCRLNKCDALFMKLIHYAKTSFGSYAWKSILWARRVISMSARWRISDGKNISIYEDSWPPKREWL